VHNVVNLNHISCNLFNDAVSSAEYTASNVRTTVDNDLHRM